MRDFPEKLGDLTKCSILIYDRQGHGGSDNFSDKRSNSYMQKEVEILSEILTTLHINQPILFGHSDGGSIALLYAAMFPEKVACVISESAHIFVEEITLDGVRKAVKNYTSGELKLKLEKYHNEKTDKLFFAWSNTWLSEDFRNWNIENYLPAIKSPVLVIQGDSDEFGSLKQVEGIVNQTGGYSEQLILEEIRHTPHRESEELVLKKSAKFINKFLNN